MRPRSTDSGSGRMPAACSRRAPHRGATAQMGEARPPPYSSLPLPCFPGAGFARATRGRGAGVARASRGSGPGVARAWPKCGAGVARAWSAMVGGRARVRRSAPRGWGWGRCK
eukprot:gene1925-biopygen13963